MRNKLFTIIGLALILIIISSVSSVKESVNKSTGLAGVLCQWGEEQEDNSEVLTDAAVSGLEGTLVGEHEIDGANWSIPNLIRHWVGGD